MLDKAPWGELWGMEWTCIAPGYSGGAERYWLILSDLSTHIKLLNVTVGRIEIESVTQNEIKASEEV